MITIRVKIYNHSKLANWIHFAVILLRVLAGWIFLVNSFSIGIHDVGIALLIFVSIKMERYANKINDDAYEKNLKAYTMQKELKRRLSTDNEFALEWYKANPTEENRKYLNRINPDFYVVYKKYCKETNQTL